MRKIIVLLYITIPLFLLAQGTWSPEDIGFDDGVRGGGWGQGILDTNKYIPMMFSAVILILVINALFWSIVSDMLMSYSRDPITKKSIPIPKAHNYIISIIYFISGMSFMVMFFVGFVYVLFCFVAIFQSFSDFTNFLIWFYPYPTIVALTVFFGDKLYHKKSNQLITPK